LAGNTRAQLPIGCARFLCSPGTERGRIRLGIGWNLIVLTAVVPVLSTTQGPRILLHMPAPRFKIGQPVIYHGKRKDIVGRYIVLTIISQRLGKFRYRIRNDEDEAVEFTVNERELHEFLTGVLVLRRRKGHRFFCFG
jgi:hypothetical protein